MLDAHRVYARKVFKSGMDFEFHNSEPIRVGSLKFLKAKRPEAYFFRSHTGTEGGSKEVLIFLRKNKPLFLVDDETINSLKNVSDEIQGPIRLLQTYKGIPVFDSTVSAEASSGISDIHSTLVPTSKLNPPSSIKPQITAEKVSGINWKKWLSKGIEPTLKVIAQTGADRNSYTVQVTRTMLSEGKKVVEEDSETVYLVLYPQKNTAKLAWCSSGSSAVYDAMSGELLAGEAGPRPQNISYFMSPNHCPYWHE